MISQKKIQLEFNYHNLINQINKINWLEFNSFNLKISTVEIESLKRKIIDICINDSIQNSTYLINSFPMQFMNIFHYLLSEHIFQLSQNFVKLNYEHFYWRFNSLSVLQELQNRIYLKIRRNIGNIQEYI